MNWQTRYTRAFAKELARLPRAVREEVEEIAFGDAIKSDPFLGGKAEKMTGYRDYYKIRIGSYRIGLRINQADHLIEF